MTNTKTRVLHHKYFNNSNFNQVHLCDKLLLKHANVS